MPGKPAGISQTSFIFATVFVAYLIFITLNGDLPQWLGVLGFGKAPPAQAATNSAGQISSLTGASGGTGATTGGSGAMSKIFGNMSSGQAASMFGKEGAVALGYGGSGASASDISSIAALAAA